jgi:hypothetical protein
MVRIQIQLDAARHREVKRCARQLGISVAEVVRRCIDSKLQSQAPETRADRVRRAVAALGKYADPRGTANVARDHDASLAEAYRR